MVIDVNGLRIEKGDVVAPITGDFKGRVCATKMEEGEGFVCIRAAHRPYSKGVWYAADHVQRLAVAPRRREEPSKPGAKPVLHAAKPAGDSDGEADTRTAAAIAAVERPLVKIAVEKRPTPSRTTNGRPKSKRPTARKR